MTTIDLNADLGEGMGNDDDLLDIVSSASIAGGGHAGDAATIRHVLRKCKARGVRAGAHPGYVDRARFGRFRLVVPLDTLLSQVRDQIFLVRYIAEEIGVPLSYVKLHGALANQTAEELAFAVAIFAAIQAMDPKIAVLALDIASRCARPMPWAPRSSARPMPTAPIPPGGCWCRATSPGP